MKHFLVVSAFALAVTATAVHAEEELSDAQRQRMDEFLKQNPEFREEFDKLEKQGIRITKFGPKEPTAAEAAAANFKGSAGTAEDAYKHGDYETAMKHYKALAAEGDGRAALMVGIMHQQGEGVPKDKSAAYAWYGRAAEQGDGAAGEIVRGMNDNDELSKEEYEAAGEKYREITKELDGDEGVENADSRFREIQEETNVYVRPRSK